MGVSQPGEGAEGLADGHRVASRRDAARSLVLLVEDDDTIATLVTRILERGHRQVIRACDGTECLRLLVENTATIGLVILDCRLPDIDGETLCREVRRHAPDVPVLLTSGRHLPKEVVAATYGATAFLAKPFRPVDVEKQVATLLGAIP